MSEIVRGWEGREVPLHLWDGDGMIGCGGFAEDRAPTQAADSLWRTETVVEGDSRVGGDESLNRAESVIITNA